MTCSALLRFRHALSGKAEGTPDEIARVTAHNAAQVAMKTPKASLSDFVRHFPIPKNGLLLFGTAGSCFMLDVAYYGLSMNNALILQIIGYSDKGTHSTYEQLYNIVVGNIIIVLAGAVPGYWVTVATVDTLGRKTNQMGGFIILTLLFIVMGFGYNHIKNNSPDELLAIHVLAQFFFNFGPTATTFIVPGELVLLCCVLPMRMGRNYRSTILSPIVPVVLTSHIGEVFPTRYRSTAHGISAASGKVGFIIGQGAISTLRSRGAPPGSKETPWMNHVLQIYALFMLIGCFTTWFIPETKRKTLEELCGEDQPAPASSFHVAKEPTEHKSVQTYIT